MSTRNSRRVLSYRNTANVFHPVGPVAGYKTYRAAGGNFGVHLGMFALGGGARVGLVVFWPFFVFSCSYLAWREKSWWHAVWVTFCIHAFQNVLPTIAIVSTL